MNRVRRGIPLARPRLGSAELRAIERVLRSRQVTSGPEVRRLEREVSNFLGGRPVAAVSSGGAALLLAMAAARVGPGTEVVVPAFTFPAAAQAALFLGAEPVPADVDPESLCVTPASVAVRLSSRTRAVVVAHAFGIPADVESVVEGCRDRGVTVIEDAACAFGGRTAGGRIAGTVADYGCFSLHARKAMTAGEGGLVTADPERLSEIRDLLNYGRRARGFGDVFQAIGLNFRLSDLAAALARAQLRRVRPSIRRRARLVARYREHLDRIQGVHVPLGYHRDGQTWQSLVVRVENAPRVVEALARHRIESGPAAHALTEQSFFCARLDVRRVRCPHAEALAREALALPLFDEMTARQVREVCAALQAVLREVEPRREVPR